MEHGRDHVSESLPDYERQIAELRQLNFQLQATVSQYHEQLAQAAEQIALLKKALWSPRRERYIPDPNQPTLFQPESLGESENESSDESETEDSDADDEPLPEQDSNRQPAG